MRVVQIKTIDEIKEFENSKEPVYFLAGATDIMVYYKDGLIPENSIILNIGNLDELKSIEKTNGYIKIGALVTFNQIIENELTDKYCQCLVLASRTIGSPQIRNRATIGGNIGNASPAGDSLPALMVHNAKIVTTIREYKIEEVFKGVKQTSLINGEMIKYIMIPVETGYKSFFKKSGPRQALSISKASLACMIKLDREKIEDIRISAGAVGITPLRLKKTEEFLKGKLLKDIDTFINKACNMLADEISPIDDFRSTAEYRKNVLKAYLEDILNSIK